MSSSNEDTIDVGSKTNESLAWFTMVPVALHIIRFINSIILARLLSPEDFGIVGIATVLLYFSNSLTEFGFAKAIVQRKNVDKGHYNAYFSFNIIVSIVLFITFTYFSNNIAIYFHEPKLSSAIEIMSVLFLISALVTLPKTVHQRSIHFKNLAIAEAVKVAVSISISLSMALAGFDFIAIIFAMVVSDFIAMIYIRFTVSLNPSFTFNLSSLRDLIGFGIWDFLWGQSKNLSDNIDKLIIGKVLDVAQLGYFEKAQGLARMPNDQFSVRIGDVSFSTFSRVQNDPLELYHYLSKIMIVNAFVCFPVYIGLYLVAENFTLVLLGDKWAAMIEPLKILSASFLVTSLMGPIISINIAMGQIKHQTVIRLIGVVLLVSLLMWSVKFGIVAVSYAILFFNIALFIASFLLLKQFLSISIKQLFSFFFPALVSSLIMFLAIDSVSFLTVIEGTRSLTLITEVIVGMLLYILCVVFIPFKEWVFIRKKSFVIVSNMASKLFSIR